MADNQQDAVFYTAETQHLASKNGGICEVFDVEASNC